MTKFYNLKHFKTPMKFNKKEQRGDVAPKKGRIFYYSLRGYTSRFGEAIIL